MNTIVLENTIELAKACMERLKEAMGPGLPLRLEAAKRGYDFDLHIGTKPAVNLAIEVKARIDNRNQALHIILQLKGQAGNAGAMVFTHWIPEPAAEEFRRAGVFFIDAQGNAFIQKPPQVVVDIRGRKPDRPLKAEPGRLIEMGGLKIIHYLLTHPQAVGDPLRAIAGGADVALGTAQAVMKELQNGQWLLPAAGGTKRFGDIKGLIELFVRGYAFKLRPVCLLGRYRHKMRAPQEILEGFAQRLAGMGGHWAVTGGMAAREMTHYLEPDAVALFVDDQARTKLEGEPMLRDDAAGNVTVFRLFGAAAIGGELKVPWPLATPLLIYAELLEAGGAREVETAQMIYERFLEAGSVHG